MRVNRQILDSVIENLETSKCRHHILGSQTADYVPNFNSDHYSNVLYLAKSISRFTMIFHLWIMKVIPVQGSAAMSYFSHMESVPKGVSTFLNIWAATDAFTTFIMWSFWSILKPIGDWKIRKYGYLRTDTYWDLISKAPQKILLSSVNYVPLLVLLITYSL